MSDETRLRMATVGYQVRTADGAVVIGDVEGVRREGVRIHKIPGHARHTGYNPDAMITYVDAATNTVIVASGIGIDQVVDAPPPLDESPDGWHMSSDWWSDLLGHYGLFTSEGRGSEPFLHADQR